MASNTSGDPTDRTPLMATVGSTKAASSPPESANGVLGRWGRGLRAYWASHGQGTLSAVVAWPTVVHVAAVILLTWILGRLNFNALFVVTWMVVFLWKIQDSQSKQQRHRMRVEIYKEEFLGKNTTPDDESTHWLNMVLERAWGCWLERVVSLHLVPTLAPWFLNTYKPVVLTKLELKSVNMGSQPPLVTSARVYQKASSGKDLELEMNLRIVSAKDMFMQFTAHVGSAAWAGLGLIPWTAYATDLTLVGRARVGVSFAPAFPFVDSISVSFIEEPELTLAIKVMGMGLGKGFDAGGLPLVADYVKSTLTRALGCSLVAPNSLVIEDIVELLKDILPKPGDAAQPVPAEGPPPPAADHPVASVHVEVLQGLQLQASDANGLSDPYVKGSLGPAKFVTAIKKKTLNPVWREDFRVPVFEWEGGALLRILVRDYDRYTADDDLGMCEIDVAKLRDGQRHEMSVLLSGCKSGKLLLAITVHEEAESDNVDKAVHHLTTADGEEARVEVKTVKQGDRQVASASAVLTPKESAKQLEPTGPPEGKLQSTRTQLTTRRVDVNNSTRKEVAPGCVVVAWDM